MTTTERLRELLAAATPGPWVAWLRENYDGTNLLSYRQRTVIGVPEGEGRPEALGHWTTTGMSFSDREDAALIVEAVNSLPKLLAVVEAAQALRDGALERTYIDLANLSDALAALDEP